MIQFFKSSNARALSLGGGGGGGGRMWKFRVDQRITQTKCFAWITSVMEQSIHIEKEESQVQFKTALIFLYTFQFPEWVKT